jgi:hypothetical protein
MPLLQVQQVKRALRESGISDKNEIQKLLELEGLGPGEVISELASVMRGADNSATKMRALDTALKLNGLLKNDEGVLAPTVNIIIHDSEFSGANPILIPRPE